MIENTPPADVRNQDFWKIVPGLLVSLIALAALFFLGDWPKFLAALQLAELQFIWWALPVHSVSYFTRARGWHLILLEEPPYKKVFFTMQAGYLLNNVLPFRLGELGRAFLLGRTGLGFWRVFSTIMVERAFDLILAIALLLGTLPFVVAIPGARQMTLVVGLVVLLGFGFLYFLARQQHKVLVWFDRLGQRWPRPVELTRSSLESFLIGLSALADGTRFWRVLGWMVLSWILAVCNHYLVLRAFVPDAKILWIAFALGVAALGVALPSSPASIGIYEAAFVGALAVFGVPFENALAFALVNHAIYVAATGILGLYALSQEGESLTALFRAIRKQPTRS